MRSTSSMPNRIISPDLLMPNVWFSRTAGDRWLQVGDQRLQVPLRIGVYSHQARVVRFVYPGVYKIYGKAVVNGPGVLPALKDFIDVILAQDELYEHWISVGMLHRVAHEGEPHFLRIEPKRVGAYTGIYENPRGSIHYPCPGEGHSHNAIEQSRRLAVAYREDILNTRWTRSPEIENQPSITPS